MLLRKLLAIGAVFALPDAAAWAQASEKAEAKITEITGSSNFAVALRGERVLTLSEGDRLLEGDRIFTRTKGTLRIAFAGCAIELQSQSYLQLARDTCSLDPNQFAYEVFAKQTDTKIVFAENAPRSIFDLANIVSGGGASAYQDRNDDPVHAFGP